MSLKIPSEMLRYLVLFACMEKPSYGYEVVSSVEELSNCYWSPSYGTIYPLIQRLQEEGLLRELNQEEVEERGLDGSDRNYFEITEEGRSEILEMEENKDEYLEEFREQILGYMSIFSKTYSQERFEDLLEEAESIEDSEYSC